MNDQTQVAIDDGGVLDDLVLAYLQSVEAGQPLDRDELLARHPDLADDLREFFANQDRLTHLADELPTPPERGAPLPRRIRYFGDYESLEEIAQGGMGVVFKARQKSLNRTVAVKMIRGAERATDSALRRFRAEAEAVAQLEHPGIVSIYEVGEHEGQPYFSMEYVAGASLAELAQQGPFVAHEAAEFIRQAAEAVHFAHLHGVLHRDLKPSNLLLDSSGRVRITDFGLAKCADSNSHLTATGEVLGTPSYMSPEQASGRSERIGAASDVYGLGAVLYELLTGRAPHRAATAVETLRQVQDVDPVTPRALNPAVPRDLETIALRCLQKRSADRYATAAALAEDLGRYLRGEPILARPITPTARLWRWCRRKPVVASLSAAVLLLLVTVAIVATVAAIRIANDRDTISRQNSALVIERDRANNAEADERRANHEYREALYRSNIAHARASRFSGRAGRRFEALAALTEAARFRPSDALRAEAITCMSLADLRPLESWDEGGRFARKVGAIDFDPALEQFALDTGKGEIAIYRVRDRSEALRLPRVGADTESVLFSPDGSKLAALYKTRGRAKLCVWDLGERRAVIDALGRYRWKGLDFSPDGRWFAAAREDGYVDLFDLEKRGHARPLRVDGSARFVSFHPTGNRLAVSLGDISRVVVCDITSGQRITEWNAPPGIESLAWHPDGKRMLIGCRNAMVYVLRGDAAGVERALPGHSDVVSKLAVSSSANLLASHGWDGRAIFWDLKSFQRVLEMDGDVIRFSPDGQRLAWHNGSHLGTWSWEPALESQLVYHPPPWGDPVQRVAFHPTLPLLAGCGPDGVRLWETTNGQEVGRLSAQSTRELSFNSSDGSLLASSGDSIWRYPVALDDTQGVRPKRVRIGPRLSFPTLQNFRVRGFAVDREGKRLVVAVPDRGQAAVMTLPDPHNDASGNPAASAAINFIDTVSGMFFVAISPDGKWAALGNYQYKNVDVLDLERQRRAAILPLDGSTCVAFSSDSRTLITGNMHAYRLWEVGSWKERHALPNQSADIQGAAEFSPDVGMLAVTQSKYLVQLLSPDARQVFAQLEPGDRPPRIFALAWSPDSTMLAVAQGEAGLRLWDLRRVRDRLAEMNLDWQPPQPSRKAAETATYEYVIDLGQFRYAEDRLQLAGNLVPAGSEWRYNDQGADLGVAWRHADFDDSKWPAGGAPLGFGIPDVGTLVGHGSDPKRKPLTSYFRHVFEIDNPATIADLVLATVRDDGVAVYLNGQEVFRDNLPADAKFSDIAVTNVENREEVAVRYAAIDPGRLRPGRNVLAVEVHQHRATSSDLLFDLQLSMNVAADLERRAAEGNVTAAELLKAIRRR